ncbi:VCBS repeat-containing protein [Gemmata sp. JC673]|uniref:VCBS repeat-containing protein n=1 Tax=Gemmata algarum TaxID=2975278 RepID=A0ABU5F2A1_9BACT|nr:VCBS repeat-containing protein [Gemmata algarum]MDY3561319.1 VCBS repeat-containing protein [Gemmata algarum]
MPPARSGSTVRRHPPKSPALVALFNLFRFGGIVKLPIGRTEDRGLLAYVGYSTRMIVKGRHRDNKCFLTCEALEPRLTPTSSAIEGDLSNDVLPPWPAAPVWGDLFSGYAGTVSFARIDDVTGDGQNDSVAWASDNGHVVVFDGRTGVAVRSFLASSGYIGTTDVNTGDLDGDGYADIITGAGLNGHVKVFDGRTLRSAASWRTPVIPGP